MDAWGEGWGEKGGGKVCITGNLQKLKKKKKKRERVGQKG